MLYWFLMFKFQKNTMSNTQTVLFCTYKRRAVTQTYLRRQFFCRWRIWETYEVGQLIESNYKRTHSKWKCSQEKTIIKRLLKKDFKECKICIKLLCVIVFSDFLFCYLLSKDRIVLSSFSRHFSLSLNNNIQLPSFVCVSSFSSTVDSLLLLI